MFTSSTGHLQQFVWKVVWQQHLLAACCSKVPHQRSLYLHPFITETPHRQGKHKLAEADRQALILESELGRDPIHMRASLDQNPAFTWVCRSTPTSPPLHPSLHLLAFLHLSLPLIKTLNWLIHTCSCTGSFGTSLHHQSRFSHQRRVHSGAHCPSLTYRAKQWSQTGCVCVGECECF